MIKQFICILSLTEQSSSLQNGVVLGGAGRDEIFRIDYVTDRRVRWSTLPAADMCSFQHISAGCRKRFQVTAEKTVPPWRAVLKAVTGKMPTKPHFKKPRELLGKGIQNNFSFFCCVLLFVLVVFFEFLDQIDQEMVQLTTRIIVNSINSGSSVHESETKKLLLKRQLYFSRVYYQTFSPPKPNKLFTQWSRVWKSDGFCCCRVQRTDSTTFACLATTFTMYTLQCNCDQT